MQIFHNLDEWQLTRRLISSTATIGFVPTLGNLHQGHASLYKKSCNDNDLTVASIFINPTQFNQTEDFVNYPRTLEADIKLLKDAGVDYCVIPEKEAMYADGFRYKIEETELSQIMEGKHRPGHFNGVLTIVMKLLNLVKPHHAYFGEKDYQQYLLIRHMVQAFFMDITIHACPTIREESKLAYSSRNGRLNPEQRLLAEKFAQIFHQNKSCELLTTSLREAGIDVEYLLDYEGRRFTAVNIGSIRLIDNYKKML